MTIHSVQTNPLRWLEPLAALVLVATVAACEAGPAAPDGYTPVGAADPAYAPGGVPGPPTDVIIPRRIGAPPHARIRIPPHAGPPAFLASLVEVGAGLDFSCALRSDGAAFCWGENLNGQLGDGTTVASAAPVRVNTTIPFARLFVGDITACGLEADGTAHCWGDNSRGQLGAGVPDAMSSVPVPVAAPHQFSDLSLGLRAHCGIDLTGVAYCWGLNSNGWLGVGSADPFTTVPMPVVNGAAIGLSAVNTSGITVNCGLAPAGDVFCWGLDLGDFGNGSTASLESLVPVPAASGAQFASIHVANGAVCALDDSGQAFCWGRRNDFGEMGIGSTEEPIVVPTAVVGGLTFASLDTDDTNRSIKSTCGVTPAGDGWCWGANTFGQLGAQSAEQCQRVAQPFSDVCSTSPLLVDGGIQFTQIRVGGDHACGLALDGAAYCWGRNHVGQIGDGTLMDRAAPVPVLPN